MNRLLEQQREKLVDRIDKLNQQLKSESLPGIPDYVVDAQQKQVLEAIAVYEAEIRELDEQLK
jgi:hypothetical protein